MDYISEGKMTQQILAEILYKCAQKEIVRKWDGRETMERNKNKLEW